MPKTRIKTASPARRPESPVRQKDQKGAMPFMIEKVQMLELRSRPKTVLKPAVPVQGRRKASIPPTTKSP